MSEIEYLYRYEHYLIAQGYMDEWDNYQRTGPNKVRVFVIKYTIVKKTPKGAWIAYNDYPRDKKFVLLTANKKFACLTEEEALESYIARKKRQISILSAKIGNAEAGIREAERMQGKESKIREIKFESGGSLFERGKAVEVLQ